MIDQAWQPHLVNGMVRAYLVEDRVAGFGHQAVNALFPAVAGQAAVLQGQGCTTAPTSRNFRG